MKKLLAVLMVTAVATSAAAGVAQATTHKPINESKIWKQRWSKATASERSWVRSTRACETQGMTDAQAARANTGNGYYGAVQFDAQTWWAAPATGRHRGEAHELPHHEPLLVQYVVAIKKMRRDGPGAWPNCG